MLAEPAYRSVSDTGPSTLGSSVLSRILSGLFGALILCVSAVFTLGTSLAAPGCRA